MQVQIHKLSVRINNIIIILTVCSDHVTYAFQSESTLFSCLHVKELLARSRTEISSLSDCNCTRTHNHLLSLYINNQIIINIQNNRGKHLRCGSISSSKSLIFTWNTIKNCGGWNKNGPFCCFCYPEHRQCP